MQSTSSMVIPGRILTDIYSLFFEEHVDAFNEYKRTTLPGEVEMNPKLTNSIRRIYDSESVRSVLQKQHQIALLDSAL